MLTTKSGGHQRRAEKEQKEEQIRRLCNRCRRQRRRRCFQANEEACLVRMSVYVIWAFRIGLFLFLPVPDRMALLSGCLHCDTLSRYSFRLIGSKTKGLRYADVLASTSVALSAVFTSPSLISLAIFWRKPTACLVSVLASKPEACITTHRLRKPPVAPNLKPCEVSAKRGGTQDCVWILLDLFVRYGLVDGDLKQRLARLTKLVATFATHWIILGVDDEDRYIDGEYGVCRRRVSVIRAFSGVAPCRTLYLSIKFM